MGAARPRGIRRDYGLRPYTEAPLVSSDDDLLSREVQRLLQSGQQPTSAPAATQPVAVLALQPPDKWAIYAQAADYLTDDNLAGYEVIKARYPALDWEGHDSRYALARVRLGIDSQPVALGSMYGYR
jgi:hypothetical protein